MTLPSDPVSDPLPPLPAAPQRRPAVTVIRPPAELPILNLAELWQGRHMLSMMVWRAVRVRYKQTAIGAGWAILQPLMLMAVFSIFFGWLTRVPSDGLPYPAFVYTALTLWQFFSRAVSDASAAIVQNPHLVTKIYFPRLFLPLAAVLAALVDLGFGLLALVPLLVIYELVPTWGLLLLPGFILMSVLLALGVSLMLAALYAVYRDVGHLLPFIVQVWMFATPIIYPSSLVPPAWQTVYHLMNPMVVVVEAARWALLGADAPGPVAVAAGALTTLGLLAWGYLFFRRREAAMSDMV